jgi:hypothetical protein
MMKHLILSLPWVLASVGIAPADATFPCESNGTRIQQLRIYDINRDNREPFHRRFQDHALRIMKRHEFDVIDLWESEAGDNLQFIYLLSWPDAATMDRDREADGGGTRGTGALREWSTSTEARL